jgi:hypothetical protein
LWLYYGAQLFKKIWEMNSKIPNLLKSLIITSVVKHGIMVYVQNVQNTIISIKMVSAVKLVLNAMFLIEK